MRRDKHKEAEAKRVLEARIVTLERAEKQLNTEIEELKVLVATYERALAHVALEHLRTRGLPWAGFLGPWYRLKDGAPT